MSTPPSIEAIRHSAAHMLAAAVLKLYPGTKLAIGPAIEHGFYYDFLFPEGVAISDKELKAIEVTMKKIISGQHDFIGRTVTADEAKQVMADQPFKHELIDEFSGGGETLTVYESGPFVDLCRGGHVHNTKEIPTDALKLNTVAGAYWRGDEKRPMLTRVYGWLFATKEELDAHLKQREEAKQRDHRKLGKELDLFTFSELVGSGLPLFTPRGTILREEINRFSQSLREARGYTKVWVPHITKKDLYETSGHWDKFGDELFLVKSQETSDELVMKPMNCPHHQQIYASGARSYRDLPLRYLETTTIYRDEKAGELLGLSRVRAITQDDSHIFMTPDHLEPEFDSILQIVQEFYRVIDMPLKIRLSFRDPATPDQYLGEAALWDKAEGILTAVAERHKMDYFTAPGEAAFYGPKIDFMALDSLGRQWQVATAQLDFVQPSRFGLTYTDSGGLDQTPIMGHVAIAGSLERFLSVYIEHTAGNFPVWLAPVQVALLPVSDKHIEWCEQLKAKAWAEGLRVSVDLSGDTVGKKIRNHTKLKIPYLLVIGDKEIEADRLAVRKRGSEETTDYSVDDFIAQVKQLAQTRSTAL